MDSIYFNCRAVKQDLTCTKEVVRKACGEDAAEIYDTYGRIMQHELGKVRGCDIPGELYGIITSLLQR